MRLPAASTVAVVVVLSFLTTGLPAGAAPGVPAKAVPDGIVVKDGVTQPVFPYDQSLTESVLIETTIDSDRDGRRDRVHAVVRRPGATATGLKVASLIEPSPYWAGIKAVPNHGVDVGELPQGLAGAAGPQGLARAAERPGIRAAAEPPGSSLLAAADVPTKEYYVTRGYAYIEAESIGTGASEGCPTSGDANETRAMRAVVDWLTGRARGWNPDGTPARASWSTGSVGMMGVSYNGTLPNQVATTGVPGLKTIVPISAISSWYDYYRANGLVVAPGGFQGEDTDVMARAVLTRKNPAACSAELDRIERRQDRVTGDYDQFWRERDYVAGAGNIRASVFLTHGLNDWNVKSSQFAQWWKALGDAGVPRKLWLHPGAHGKSVLPAWRDAVHRWIDHWLYRVPNGIEREPIATVERNTGTTTSYRNWPDPAARPVTLELTPGTLGRRSAPPRTVQPFVDSGATLRASQLVLNPHRPSPNRLAYVTPRLRAPARISGTPSVRLRASVQNRTAANLTAVLVDYGPYGAAPVIVTRGWTDVQNRGSVQLSSPVLPGKEYTFRWDQEPKDYIVEAGHRIGLVVLSTDYDYTLRPLPGTEFSVRPGASELVLPIVGGWRGLRF